MKAVSYARFSSPLQAKGHSIERQVESAKEFCLREAEEDLQFDASLSISDKGLSAFMGHNVKRGSLGHFLAEVKMGYIPTPIALIVENLDRLSREGIDATTDLLKELHKSGVSVFVIDMGDSGKLRAGERVSLPSYIMIAVAAELAYQESLKKSNRSRDGKKKARERTKLGELYGNRLPSWLELKERSDGKSEIIEIKKRADVVRKMFKLSAQGLGSVRIARQLSEEGAGWITTAWVSHHLKDRAVLGEFVSNKEELICKDYYPQTVDPLLFARVRKNIEAKIKKNEHGRLVYSAGRATELPDNLFVGRIFDVSDNEPKPMILRSMNVSKRNCREHVNPYSFQSKTSYTYLVSESKVDRNSQNCVPYAPFEKAVRQFFTDRVYARMIACAESEDLKKQKTKLETIKLKIEEKEEQRTKLEKLLFKVDEAALSTRVRLIADLEKEIAGLTDTEKALEIEIEELKRAAKMDVQSDLGVMVDRKVVFATIRRLIKSIDVLFVGDPKLWHGICVECGKPFTSNRSIARFCPPRKKGGVSPCYMRERDHRLTHGITKPPFADLNNGQLRSDRKAMLYITYNHNIDLPRQIEIDGDQYSLMSQSNDKEGRKAITEHKTLISVFR